MKILSEETKHKNRERTKLWKINNPEKHKEQKKKERTTEAFKLSRARVRERKREENAARTRQWHKDNRDKSAAQCSLRRCRKKQACPNWLTKDQKEEMTAFYTTAAAVGGHVDHIIPLTNKDVCGLHVPWNLQVLTPEENLKKSNEFLLITT
jgi:Na+-translocating ferredoxin:NAD+ oxidoreductase RnfC subunit